MDSRVQWADLLPELLSRIVDRLEDRADIRHFRAVCRSWRSSSSSCRIPPILIPLHHPPINGPLEFKHTPPELAIFSCSIYLLVPFQESQDQSPTTHPVPWLLRLQEWNPGKYKLRSALMPHSLPKTNDIDPSRFRVIHLAKTYHFTRRRHICEENYKVILLSNPKSSDIAALVLSGYGRVYCVRSREEEWEPVVFLGADKIDDIVLYKGVVHAVDIRGCLYRINKTLRVDSVSAPLWGYHYPETRKRLVELNGELYLVCKINCKFHVYKLNERRCWCIIDNIGDKILFVGIDCCFFASAEVFPTWKENGIVFHFSAFETDIGCRFPDLSWEHYQSNDLIIKTVYYVSLDDMTLKATPVAGNILLCPPILQSGSSDKSESIRMDASKK